MTQPPLETKVCRKCSTEKTLDQFYFRKDNGKYRTDCIECHILDKRQNYNKEAKSDYNKKYGKKNKKKISKRRRKHWAKNKKEINAKRKIQRLQNIDKAKEIDRKSREKNKDKIRVRKKRFYKKNKKKILGKQYARNKVRRKNDPSFALRLDFSRMIGYALTKGGFSKSGKSILNYLEYTFDELKEHIEKQFEPWMNWSNRSRYKPKSWIDDDQSTWVWQLDHIIPQSDLTYTSMEDQNFKKCWALSNLRPLSAKQNWLDGTGRVRHRPKSST